MRKNFFRLSAIIIALSLSQGMLFTACDDKNETASDVHSEKSAEQAKSEGVKGDFELQIFVGGYGDNLWKDAMDGFKKENPDVNLIVNMGPRVNDLMNTRWLSGNPPDFIFLEGPNIPKDQFVNDKKLMELTSWFETTKNKGSNILIKDKLLPNIIRLYNGKIYEAPILFNCWGMWYDEKLFNENGVKPPDNFEELLIAGEKLKSKGIPAMCYTGVYPGYIVNGVLLPAIASEGGERLLNEVTSAKNPEVYKSEPFKKVLNKLKTIVDKGYMIKGTVALNHIQSQMEWLNRKAALIPNGLWLETEMKKVTPSDFKMKYIPCMFQDKNQKMSIIPYGVSVGIAAKAKNPEAAKAFLEYIYRDEVMKAFVEASGSPSAVKINISNANITEVTKDVMKKISSSEVEFITQFQTTPGPVDKAINDAINSIVLGKITVDEACNKIYIAVVNENNK